MKLWAQGSILISQKATRKHKNAIAIHLTKLDKIVPTRHQADPEQVMTSGITCEGQPGDLEAQSYPAEWDGDAAQYQPGEEPEATSQADIPAQIDSS